MLKGISESFPLMIGVIIFVLIVSSLALVFYSGAVDVEVFYQSAKNTVDELHLAYIAGKCLESETRLGVIEAANLGEKKKILFSEITGCRINDDKVAVTLKDLQTGEVWKFGSFDAAGEGRKIFVNIKSGDEIHLGELIANA